MDEEYEEDKTILEWYERLSTRRVDLVGDYAGNELFLLEGDSLLLDCFSDPMLDFHYGFQVLHAVFLVENFLHNLVRRKCNFHIVFFDSNANLCVPPAAAADERSKYLLARSIIIRHLQAHLPTSHPDTKIFDFKSTVDANFKAYLEDNGTYFIMCHDGAVPDSSATLDLDTENADAMNTQSSEHEIKRKIALRSMIYSFIAQGYNAALLNGLDFIDTKVMTLVLEGNRRTKIQLEVNGHNVSELSGPVPVDEAFSLTENLARFDLATKQDSADHSAIDGAGHAASQITLLFKSPLECKCSSIDAIKPPRFTERGFLTIVTLSQILEKDASFAELAGLLLAHTVLLEKLCLSDRRQATRDYERHIDSRASTFVSHFANTSHSILSTDKWSSAMKSGGVKCDVADLIDGRLFRALHHTKGTNLQQESTASSFSTLAHALCAISGVHLNLPSGDGDADPAKARSNGITSDSLTILPFSNTVFDQHLRSIHIAIAKPTIDRQMGRIHKEITHWHNAKRPLIVKAVTPLNPREAKRTMRRNDFFMAEMQAYAASLTNATGKSLEPEIVTVSDKPIVKATQTKESNTNSDVTSRPNTPKLPKGKAAGKKPSGKQAMMNDIAANKAVKDSENVDKIFSAWRIVRTDLAAEKSLQSQYFKITAFLNNLSDAKKAVLKPEVTWNLLNVLLKIYSILRKQKDAQHTSEKYGTTALLFDTARKLAVTDGLTKTIATQLQLVIDALRLPDIDIPTPSIDRNLAYDPGLRLTGKGELDIGLEPREFQLAYSGPYMDRNLDSAPDSRVPFEPDGWQRRVLDELDKDHSVFVVAPTSAGKTFISFYAMERILRANDDSVLVYVAPTKALVNQIAAEIQARFRKTYKYAGKSVWAIHTRDYRINNPTGCQILVTVPHILQIMLLAPGNAKTWSPKVKYIIFDEIHSIGQAEDGVVWEQLLLLAPCPIIALSATVGNPEAFSSWLTSTQKSIGHDLTMIQHHHRYSDLRKFVYEPPTKFAFRGLTRIPAFGTLGLDGLDGLHFVHPAASLVDRSRGMPEDLHFEARDCYSLFQSMAKHQNKDYPVDSNLDPATGALPQIIKKKDIIEWERRLKKLLKTWMADDQSPFTEVIKDLSKSMSEPRNAATVISNGEIPAAADDDLVKLDPDDLFATTLPLLCQLQERDALPAIFFNYDRSRCEHICQHVIQQLEIAETKYKETNPAWKKKVMAFEEWQKLGAAKKQEVKATSGKKGKGNAEEDGGSKLDRMQDASSEANPFEGFDPLDPVDGYHFAAKHKAEAKELERHFWVMKKRNLPQWLMDGLKRGIGVHHAGMNRKYRQVVEMLFRKGFLRVVIATGTLALGINMPCATVVFAGDSVFLTALNFRQAAGRAGRRGFDLLGNVVFQGLSMSKVCRLMSSRLPDLNGHFPVTTTLVLRLFTLLHESGNAPYAVRAINALLSQPRLYLDGPAFKDQVLHHLRFSIEYLRRQDLLSSQGAPINFAGLTSHLYFTENSSFALNALIKSGYFHELCSEINDKESQVLRTLMLVMSHLFGRRQCRQADTEFIENIVKRSSSIVFLPPLPPKATQAMLDHNSNTLDVFTTYVRTFVDQHIDSPDSTLPLTGLQIGSDNGSIKLPNSLTPTKVRSAFVALSGHGDDFHSISDLCRTTRGGVFLEEAVVPHLDIYPAESKTPLNAYLYDFFMHGDLTALEKGNGVRKSDVWFMLNDFSMVLATIVASLANFLKLPDSDLSLDDVMGQGDEAHNAEDDAFADNSTDTESTATSMSTTNTSTSTAASSVNSRKPKAKKVIVDSWDDDGEDDAGVDDDEAEAWNEDGSEATKEELERGFLDIYKAFSKLRLEFDTKFRKIFA